MEEKCSLLLLRVSCIVRDSKVLAVKVERWGITEKSTPFFDIEAYSPSIVMRSLFMNKIKVFYLY